MADITVLGSFVVDLTSYTPHVPFPGETIRGGPFRMGPGGKGSNQAVAARRAGANVHLITRVGRDSMAEIAFALYRQDGIATEYVEQSDRLETGVALILVEQNSGQNSIVVAPGACLDIPREQVRRAESAIASSSVFLAQWETSPDSVEEGLTLARKHGVPTVFNPAPYSPLPESWLRRTDYLTPNETEASALSGLPVHSEEEIRACADALMQRGPKHVILTLGSRGVFLRDEQNACFLPACPVDKVVDTTGAGDCFNGAFACALSEGYSVPDACLFGNAAASICVTRHGTAPAMPSRNEILERFSRISRINSTPELV